MVRGEGSWTNKLVTCTPNNDCRRGFLSACAQCKNGNKLYVLKGHYKIDCTHFERQHVLTHITAGQLAGKSQRIGHMLNQIATQCTDDIYWCYDTSLYFLLDICGQSQSLAQSTKNWSASISQQQIRKEVCIYYLDPLKKTRVCGMHALERV